MDDRTRVVIPVDEIRVRQIVREMMAERPAPKPVPAFHIFHSWSPWAEGVVNKQGRLVQFRTCATCRKEEVRFG